MEIQTGPAALTLGIFIAFVAMVFVAGCSSSPPPTPPTTPVYTPKTTILIGSASFNPQVMVIDKGVTVTWLNTDLGRHIVKSDTGDPDSFTSPLLETNHRYQFTFTIPGTYGYHLADNSTGFKGTIIVNE